MRPPQAWHIGTNRCLRNLACFSRFFTEIRENEGPRLGVAGQKSRQRLDCACLQHRFPDAATRQAPTHNSRCPEAKAPVKPDALQTLARAIDRLPNRRARFHAFTPEFRDEPSLARLSSEILLDEGGSAGGFDAVQEH